MKVFLSYDHSDSELAKRVKSGLKSAGVDVWLDTDEILPGDAWSERISDALKTSRAMVVLLTPNSIRSPRVLNEVQYALGEPGYRRRLIPVLFGRESTDEGVPWILKRLNMIRVKGLEEEKEGLEQIQDALAEEVG